VKIQLLVPLQIAYTCTMHEEKWLEDLHIFAWLTCFSRFLWRRLVFPSYQIPTIKLEATLTLTYTLQSALKIFSKSSYKKRIKKWHIFFLTYFILLTLIFFPLLFSVSFCEKKVQPMLHIVFGLQMKKIKCDCSSTTTKIKDTKCSLFSFLP
jgi:hypothetical protein